MKVSNNKVVAFFGNILDKLQDLRDSIIEFVGDRLQDAVNNLKWLVSGIDNILSSMKESDNVVIAWFGNLFDKLQKFRDDIVNTVIERVTSVFDRLVEIRDFILELPAKFIEKLKELNRLLWIPRDGYFDSKVDNIAAKFPFVESADTGIKKIVSRLEGLGKTPPIVHIPLSGTSFGKQYGVKDMTVSFSWFSPYRKDFHALLSAILYVLFAFNQYFGIKSMLNATSSGAGPIVAEIGRGG